ncbi:MAG: TRAP transporter large permease [Treponemataceae bacterium]
MTVVLLVSFVAMIVLSVPIAYALGIAAALWVGFSNLVPLTIIPQRMYAGIDSFPLVAIPFFIFAGKIMSTGGISDRLIKLSSVLVGRFRGGLAYINIVASMFFAGISGSATADASSIGSILIPSMIKKNYRKDFAVSLTATAAVIGILIPPSIPMVLYGIIMNQSIGDLFLAGAIPGVLVGSVLMGISWFLARKYDLPREPAFTLKESVFIFFDGILPVLAVVIVLGGIVLGIVTPTEAAVIAVAYAFLLSVIVYKEIKISDLPKLLLETVEMNGMVMLMVATATIFSWIVTSEQIPKHIAVFLTSVIHDKYTMLFVFNVILLVAGCILDLTPAMIIFIPVLAPIAMQMGVNPIHFGAIVVVNLGIGLFTPPVGAVLFVCCSIAQVNMRDVIKGFLPFFIGMLCVLALVTYVPAISLWLPSMLK